jgi:primosomal protein N' (replication factor Y) (superfamily II helicase)
MQVEVALPVPVSQTFTYAVPQELEEHAIPGARVLVPFGKSERIGWIERVNGAGERRKLRELNGVLDAHPSVLPPLLELCRWIADYYIAPLGLVIRAALPAALSDSSADWIELATLPGATQTETSFSPLEARLLGWLQQHEGPQPVARLRRECGRHAWWPVIRRLAAAELIQVDVEPPRVAPPVRVRRVVRLIAELPSLQAREEAFGRARRQRECYETLEAMGSAAELAHLTGQLGFSDTVVRSLAGRGFAAIEDEEVARDPYAAIAPAATPRLRPTEAQASVIRTLVGAARQPAPGTWLLHGVTGSGKTLVYIELLREVVEAQGRTAIVLVPEIALTPQTVGRFKAVFGDRVAVLHSALSDGERYDEWRALRAGEKRIVVGARSAIFAPLRDLGAIVVDEEHEGSYKQGEAPRYHAREVATMRARIEGALCLLGSATPALESWHNAQNGKYHLLELPARIGERPLPPIRVIDLREARKRARVEGGGQRGASLILSEELIGAVRQRLEREEQSILLLNRRGYATFVQCRECGQVWHCPHCNVSLTYHRRRGRLTCHHCLHEEAIPERCSACGATDISYRGVGTEQVERAVEETFAAARIARMDVDTTSGKWAHHRILERVERGEVDILLGTQMIAKGLDFPNVTLVGVINADVGINLPDFRASERTFQLLTQVAGRAGRGAKGGEVLIQTSLPAHYVVSCAIRHDFVGFAEQELKTRREPRYPPLARLANIIASGVAEAPTQELAAAAAEWVRGLLHERRLRGTEVIGPAPCPIDRIRGRWRWHFLLRSESARLLGELARYFVERFSVPRDRHELRITVDRDPVALL